MQDPASGTGGFLIAADRFMRARTDDYFDLGEKADWAEASCLPWYGECARHLASASDESLSA
ncbi:hypothetical protein [uncultured Cohaesibacter sp.]|uniref:hypothetical protein n=1 Tax=uncultured Cohaesibacter sp. TaxID=1002546 RepID=UPI002930D50F|nr:hypothetical protein [uncultured Cohaesibacter sp.]